MHRDIDGEEFMDMVRRKFNEHNCSLKDLKTVLIILFLVIYSNDDLKS